MTDVKVIVGIICVVSVALLIGFILVNEMEKANNPLIVGTAMEGTQTTSLQYMGASYEMIALGAIVMAILMSVGVMITYLKFKGGD